MKKFICLFFSICLVLSLTTACGKPKCHTAYDGTLPQIPFLEDDTESESALGLYDGFAFGILNKTCEHGMTLTIQGKSFFFAWSPQAKKAFDILEIQIGDEVSVLVDSDEETYVAGSVELVM